MRTFTNNIIGSFGQEVNVSFTYNNNEFTNDRIQRVRFYYEGELFKSIMSCLEITSEKDELQGVKGGKVSDFTITYTFDGVDNAINYGDFIINDIERDQESGTYTYVCFDNMLLSMIPANVSDLEYPLTIKEFIGEVCDKVNYTFDNTQKVVNGDKLVDGDKYSDGVTTYRTILDEIAEATSSMIVVDKNNALKLVYLNNTNVVINEDALSQLTIGDEFGKVNSVVLGREPIDDDIYAIDEESATSDGLFEIKFNNNQIMDSEDDTIRYQFAQGILAEVDGIHFREYELQSYGIGVFELGDCFTLRVASSHLEEDEESGNVTFVNYPCVWLKCDLDISEGVIESSSFTMPQQTITNYSITSNNMDVLKQAYVKVNKLEGQITLVAENIKSEVIQEGKGSHLEQTSNGVNIHSIVKLDENGDPIYSGGYTNVNEKGMNVYDENGDTLLQAQGKIVKTGTFQTGNWRMEQSSEANGSTLDFFYVEE